MANQQEAARINTNQLNDIMAREGAFEEMPDSRPGTAASTGTLDFDSRPNTAQMMGVPPFGGGATGKVLVSAAAQAVKLDDHLRGKLEGAVSSSIDGNVVRDVLFSLAETCKEQANTIDHIRHHMKRMEAKMQHDAKHIKTIEGKMVEMGHDIANLAQNIQGFVDPALDEGMDDFGSDNDSFVGMNSMDGDAVEGGSIVEGGTPPPTTKTDERKTAEDAAKAAEAAKAEVEHQAALAAKQKADEEAKAAHEAEEEAKAHKEAAAKLAAEAKTDEEKAAAEVAAKQADDEEAKALAAEAEAKAHQEAAAAEETRSRANSSAEEVIGDDKPRTPGERLSEGAIDRAMGSASDPSKKYRIIWRRSIRTVIMMNKRKNGLVGMLKSRVTKGQSLSERLARLEESLYSLTKAIDKKNVVPDPPTPRTPMVSDAGGAGGAPSEQVDAIGTELTDLHEKMRGYGIYEGMLADLQANDAGNLITQLKSLIEHAGEEKEVRPEGSPILKNLHFIMVDLKLIFLRESSVVGLKECCEICTSAVAELEGTQATNTSEPFPAAAVCRDLRDRLYAVDFRLMFIREEMLLMSRQLDISVESELEAFHDECKTGEDEYLFSQRDEAAAVPFKDDTSDEEKFHCLARVYLRAHFRWQLAKEKVDAFESSILGAWGTFGSDFASVKSEVKTTAGALGEMRGEVTKLKDTADSMAGALEVMGNVKPPENHEDEMKKALEDWLRAQMEARLGETQEDADERMGKMAEQITRLFMSKADRDPTREDLMGKAGQNQVDDLDEMLRRLSEEIEGARGMTEKQLAAFRKKMEKMMANMAANTIEEESATTKSLFSGKPAHMTQKTGGPNMPTYDPQTGRYFLPKLGQSKGGGDVYRGGFRMPLDGAAEARRKREQDLLSRSMTDVQPGFSGGLTQQASDAPSDGYDAANRQYKWTGSQQLYRDNPKELWRANPNQPAGPAAGNARGGSRQGAQRECEPSTPPGPTDMAAWGENIGMAVGFDARKGGMPPPGSR